MCVFDDIWDICHGWRRKGPVPMTLFIIEVENSGEKM